MTSAETSAPVLSYWAASADPLPAGSPLSGSRSCEIAIIGAGFTGLSAALELSERFGRDVEVIEAAEPGWGASGRNGGFCCVGAAKLPWPAMVRRYGLDATRAFFAAQLDAISEVRAVCERLGIAADLTGEGEIVLAHRESRLAALKEEQRQLAEIFATKTEILSRSDLAARGIAGPEFHAGLWSPHGFGLHPLKYARGLARAVRARGVAVHERSPLIRWEQTGGGHVLHTPEGRLTARQVIVATNGYSPEGRIPWLGGRLLPVLSSILVTRPLEASELATQGWTGDTMAFDSRTLLHYFRLLPDGRFLFGGRGGTDDSARGADEFERRLRADFDRMFPAWEDVPHTHYWRGYACLAADRVPYVGALDEARSVWTAIAYHGNGVAMSGWAGRAAAGMAAGLPPQTLVPEVIGRRLARFPLPWLRPAMLKGAYLWYGIEDNYR